jgi:hypothetical protein
VDRYYVAAARWKEMGRFQTVDVLANVDILGEAATQYGNVSSKFPPELR